MDMQKWKPKRKVVAGGLAGAIVLVFTNLVPLLPLPAEWMEFFLNPEVSSALTMLAGLIISYWVPEPEK